MSTRVVAGLNYFGHELGAGDSAYDATNFATRIRSAEVWVRRLSSFRAYPDDGSFEPSQTTTNSRPIGRSVANTQWLIIIPGRTLLADPDLGLDRLIENLTDVKLFFPTPTPETEGGHDAHSDLPPAYRRLDPSACR